jgi:hypothetical protein
VPVITPYELELGLGAREWEGVYETSLSSYSNENDFESRLVRVKELWSRSSSGDESEGEEEEGVGESFDTRKQLSSSTIAIKSESTVTAFVSPASAYLSSREYQGLDPSIPLDRSTQIYPGQYGIASGYSRPSDDSAASL